MKIIVFFIMIINFRMNILNVLDDFYKFYLIEIVNVKFLIFNILELFSLFKFLCWYGWIFCKLKIRWNFYKYMKLNKYRLIIRRVI